MCKKIFGQSTSASGIASLLPEPSVLTRDQHPVSRKHISTSALKVLYRLNKGGYDAYLVGGGVRDLLLGLEPKDFDIVTNATPEQIKALFRNCRLIGRRFRLAHIVFGREIIEVATFRGHHSNASSADKNCKKTSKQNDEGMLLRDNIYGSIEEDAERRDFTINALYYSAINFTVHDFADGVNDIEKRQIRLIGDPETRYREDPVRMLRAIRFATKLDMEITAETKNPIYELGPLLESIPAARMFEEFSKLFISGKALENFRQLREFDLFKYFFPALDALLKREDHPHALGLVELALTNTDKRINNNQRVTPAFLFAAMLWYPLQESIQKVKSTEHLSPQDAFFAALGEIMSLQQQSISIPKRFQAVMKDIWILQDRLTKRDGKRAYKAFEHPKFRAGYDFLILRAQIEEQNTPTESSQLTSLVKWWTDFQDVNPETQQQMIKSLPQSRSGVRRSPRKRRPAKKKPMHD